MATKELFPLSYNVVEKTKNTKKLFFSLKNHLWGCRTNKYILYNFVESALQDPLTLLSYIYGKKPLRKPILYTLRSKTPYSTNIHVQCVCVLCQGKIFSTFVSEGILLQKYIIIIMMIGTMTYETYIFLFIIPF